VAGLSHDTICLYFRAWVVCRQSQYCYRNLRSSKSAVFTHRKQFDCLQSSYRVELLHVQATDISCFVLFGCIAVLRIYAAYCYTRSSVVCLSVCRSVGPAGLSVTIVSPAKAAEPIVMLFAMWTRVGSSSKEALLDGSAHWRLLANTTEPPVCRGDAAFC